MAITSGVGPHAAWLNVNGSWPLEDGSVNQDAKRKTSSFSCCVPLSYPGAYEAFANVDGGTTATITVLARGSIGTLFTGKVSEVRFDYLDRKITIRGHDDSLSLHDNKSSDKFINRKTTDIVREFAGRVGLPTNIVADGVNAGKQLEQDYVKLVPNLSYAQVISKLAEIDGARWWVDQNGVFNYVPFNNPSGTYSVTINQDSEPISSDALLFTIVRNVQAGKTIEATVKSWHPKKKQVFEYQSTVAGQGGTIKYSYHIPTLTQTDVTNRARSRAMEKAIHELTINVQVVGDTSIHAGMGLSIHGTSYFDQTYDMDEVTHSFGMRGYLTQIVARAPKSGRTAS